MRQRRPLYRCVAGVEPNDLPQSDSGSEKWLWRNLPSSSGSASVSIKTTLTRSSDFLSSDATETSFIPLRSWPRAQRPPAIRFRIGAVVVEESVIEFWDRQDSIQPGNFMNKNRGGMDLTPLGSWRRAQQSPAIRARIGHVVVEESDITLWEPQVIYKDNSHKDHRFPEF